MTDGRRPESTQHQLVAAAAIAVVALAGLSWHPSARAKEPAAPASQLLQTIARADGAAYRSRSIVAYFGAPQSNAVLDVRSSPTGRLVQARSGTDVTTMWSRSAAAELGESTDGAGAPAQVRVRPGRILAKYEIEIGDTEKLLGVDVTPLTLSRRDDGAVVERWWVQQKTGVVYKRELYGPAGELVGLHTVIEMHWGDPGPRTPAGDVQDRAAAVSSPAPDAPLRLAGNYELWRTYEVEIDDRAVDQWVYSDGLHALSVFRTRGHLRAPEGFLRLDLDGHRAYAGPGPGTWAWEGAGAGWLVVAEEPGLDAAAIIEPFPKGGPSMWGRLGSVWSRLGRAIAAPFD